MSGYFALQANIDKLDNKLDKNPIRPEADQFHNWNAKQIKK